MISDPTFYAVAVPAVLLFGIAKGGFGGGLGAAAVPLMSLAMSPVQAAAILLPILCLMDLLTLWAYRGRGVWPELRTLLPASLIGIAIGTALWGYMSPQVVKLIIGIVAMLFTLHHWARKWLATHGRHVPRTAGWLGGSTAGYTSFIAHAGGPPITMYLLRRPLNRTDFIATTAVFFAVVNYAKLIPYGWLGQLSADNLVYSLILAPLAPIGVATGVWLHRRVSDRFFFTVAYLLLFAVGVKLVRDGLLGM